MLNRAFGVRLESVGKINVRDNVFIGYQAVVMPNVTIGPNAIVAAGAVVTKDVAEGDIVAGVPARPVGRVADLVQKLQSRTRDLPWAGLIEGRQGAFDPALEPELTRRRAAHFFGHPVAADMPRALSPAQMKRLGKVLELTLYTPAVRAKSANAEAPRAL